MRAGEDLSCVRGVTTSERKADDRKDRISELHDDILCYILSFIPSDEAMGTSVLSTRWRYVWTMVPALDFNMNLTTLKRVKKFLSLRRTQWVTRFHLKYTINRCVVGYIRKLVRAAIDGKVEHLSIYLFRKDCSYLFFFPASLFECTTVVTMNLKFKGSVVLHVPPSMHLPSLKTLHLHVDGYVSFFCLGNLVRGCPALELFCLTQRGTYRLNNLKIWRSSRDTRLLESKGMFKVVSELVIRSDYDFLSDYFDRYWDCLVKVQVYITLYGTVNKRYQLNSYVFSTLQALSNVEFISLSDFRVEMTEDNEPFTLDDLPQFQNLVQLHLSLKEDVHSLFMELPAKCPKLQLLNLQWYH